MNSLISLASRIDTNQRVRLRGSGEASLAWWLSNLVREVRRPTVFVDANPRRLGQIEANLRFFFSFTNVRERPALCSFPAWDVYPYSRTSPSSEVMGVRMAAMDFLFSNGAGIVLTTPEALCGRMPPPARLPDGVLTLHEGDEIDCNQFLGCLESLMYVRRSIVESPGEYAVRGGIVDFFTPQEKRPIRLDLRGDEIDALCEFNPQTQRTLFTRPVIRVFSARELVLTDEEKKRGAAALREMVGADADLARQVEHLLDHLEMEGQFSGMEGLASFFLTEMGTFFDAVPGDAVWLINDASSIRPAAERMWVDVEEEAAHVVERGLIHFDPDQMWLRPDALGEGLSLWPLIEFDALGFDDLPAPGGEDGGLTLAAERLLPIRGQIEKFVGCLESWVSGGERTAIVARDKTQALRVQAILKDRGFGIPILPGDSVLSQMGEKLAIVEGQLTGSIRFPDEKLVFFRADDLLPGSLARVRNVSAKGRKAEGFQDLNVDDYIVHIDHGVGRYLGARTLEHAEGEDEFLHIAYAGGDKLYVPMDDIDQVHIYRGTGKIPQLDRLGGTRWAKNKRGVKLALQSIARDLVRLYSDRTIVEGVSFSSEGGWDREVAAGFEFEETKDQEEAIRDVLADMEKSQPMDRLICGDVGYGKTEVALRAAARAASSGRQVALVVPTTLLAHQHWQTFSARLEFLPVRVEMLSRFRSKKEQSEVVNGMISGAVDIVIGTHRLFQKDVAFKDLGLLIIDEEHRFGVVHKEKF